MIIQVPPLTMMISHARHRGPIVVQGPVNLEKYVLICISGYNITVPASRISVFGYSKLIGVERGLKNTIHDISCLSIKRDDVPCPAPGPCRCPWPCYFKYQLIVFEEIMKQVRLQRYLFFFRYPKL